MVPADDHLPHVGLPGVRPEACGHFLTNVLLHAVTAVLLFLVLLRMTDQRAVPRRGCRGTSERREVRAAGPSATAFWPSAWVAAVFAIHPLHVESVAWVAERRDMLSGLFFMLSLGAYTLYVERPSLARYLCGHAPVRVGADVKADTRHAALRFALARLLAAGPVSP